MDHPLGHGALRAARSCGFFRNVPVPPRDVHQQRAWMQLMKAEASVQDLGSFLFQSGLQHTRAALLWGGRDLMADSR